MIFKKNIAIYQYTPTISYKQLYDLQPVLQARITTTIYRRPVLPLLLL